MRCDARADARSRTPARRGRRSVLPRDVPLHDLPAGVTATSALHAINVGEVRRTLILCVIGKPRLVAMIPRYNAALASLLPPELSPSRRSIGQPGGFAESSPAAAVVPNRLANLTPPISRGSLALQGAECCC